jgi:site-specific recombinase XerD
MAGLGLAGVTHHTMRHTGVTLMLEAGINPRVIQLLAGWTSLRMLERYGHVRDTEIRRAVMANAAHLARGPQKGPQQERTATGSSES